MLARKNLFEQPLRLSFSISGVALSVMLILVMWSVLQGVLSQAGAFVRNTDAQVWVVQRGFTDIAHGFSVVPGEMREPLERIEGVRSASPITVATTEAPLEGGVDSLALIGYETEHGNRRPVGVRDRAGGPEPGELVVDETFARTAGLGVGDELSLRGGSWEIVALVRRRADPSPSGAAAVTWHTGPRCARSASAGRRAPSPQWEAPPACGPGSG